MTEEERKLFVADPECRSTPLQKHHTLNQRNAIFDSCAATGMRPDIFHLTIPGRPAFPVGVHLPDDDKTNESSSRSSATGAFSHILISDEQTLNDMQMAWDGLERV